MVAFRGGSRGGTSARRALAEDNGKEGDFYLTTPGPAYEVKSTPVGPNPVRVFCVTLGLRLITEAMAEVFGEDANLVHLRDVSGFHDPFMNALMEKLDAEFTMGHRSSHLLVRGIAQSLAIHLVRNYTLISETVRISRRGLGLPGFKLRKIADFMADHIQDGFSLTRLAAEAAMSEFHFSRMFKRTTGKSPSQYFISLRMEKAQALLRGTRKEIIEVALDVGYTSQVILRRCFDVKPAVRRLNTADSSEPSSPSLAKRQRISRTARGAHSSDRECCIFDVMVPRGSRHEPNAPK